MVFGLMVYKSSTYNLAELAQTVDLINIISRCPKFLMKIGRYKVGTYKVGDTGYIDPESSFPNNRIGAYQLTKANQAQRWLPFPELDQETSEFDIKFTNLVLAHSGNSEEGLLKVFIGIPSEINEKHQIVAWSNTYDVWSKDKDGEDFLTIPKSDEPITPAERVAPPTLKLKTA